MYRHEERGHSHGDGDFPNKIMIVAELSDEGINDISMVYKYLKMQKGFRSEWLFITYAKRSLVLNH